MNHEELVREKRTIKAMEKKYMGAEGKFGTILKMLGSPIESQEMGIFITPDGEMGHAQHFLNDPYEEESEHTLDVLPTIARENFNGIELKEPEGEDWYHKKEHQKFSINDVGHVFDGLSRGFHIEIKYITNNRILTVHYQGYQVYREERGVLESYIPNVVWEDIIDKLYKIAEPLAKDLRREQRQSDVKEMETEKLSLWNRIKKTWGLE